MSKNLKNLIIVMLLAAFASVSISGVVDANPAQIPIRNKINDTTTGIQLKGGVKIDHNQQVVTLNLRNSDLRQVLRMLADKAGKNVIIHESVEGTVSVDLVNVDLNSAFEYIMMMNELTYRKDDNTLIIASQDTALDMDLKVSEIRSIPIKYTNAQKIANFLNANVFEVTRPNTSNSSIVTTNPATNEILVFGSDDDIQLAEKVVNYLDKKPNIKSFEVNFAEPMAIASKICWTAFNSDEGEDSVDRDAELEEGSEISMVCGNTAELSDSTDGDREDYNTSPYWVLVDTGLNKITIYGGTTEQLYMAEEIIKNFDVREPQVYLEVSILELSDQDTNELEWQYTLTNSRDSGFATFLENSFQIQNLSGWNGISKGTSFTINDDPAGSSSNPAILETILTNTKARLIANPRIIAANNTEATVSISEEIVESVTSTTDGNGVVTNEVNIGDGDSIEFSIIPKVSPNGYIRLSMPDFSFSTLRGKSDIADANLTNDREVGVKSVRVKDGDTFVIGGLIQERETMEHNKVPILSSIPVLGTLFQSQSATKIRSELIIMITPRILKDPDEIEAAKL